jgi:hypothetical protein
MRAFTAVLLWLITTVLLAAAVPAAWAQRNLVDRQGYQALAQRAATDGDLQAATAAELVAQIERLGYDVDPAAVNRISRAYTASSKFPEQFAQANGYAHRWLFTDTFGSDVDPQGRWVIDLAPMLHDESFAQTLHAYNVTVPDSVPIPLTDNAPRVLRPGALRGVTQWGPWVSIGLTGLAAASALLLLVVAPRRGKALVALGVSGLIVGATGWAAIEYGQRYLRSALNNTSGNTQRIAEVMAATAQDNMHQWLNVTMLAGGGMVVVGGIVSLLGGLIAAARGRRTPPPPASGAGRRNSART